LEKYAIIVKMNKCGLSEDEKPTKGRMRRRIFHAA
jgi:hypothetical protein